MFLFRSKCDSSPKHGITSPASISGFLLIPLPFQCRLGHPDCSHLYHNGATRLHLSTIMACNVRDARLFGRLCFMFFADHPSTLNYYASLVLVLSLSVKGSRVRWNLTSNQEASRRQVEMNALKLSVGVLSHCAQQDPLAAQFLKTVNVFKVILEAQDLSEPEEVRRFSSGAANPEQVTTSASHMSRSSSYFETASTGSRSHLPLSTASSPFDLQAYPSPSSLPHPSFRHIQPTSAPQLASPLAPTASQNGSFSMPLDWSPSSILVMNSAMDVSIDYESGLVGPPTQHYQPFLQDLYQFEDIYSGSQC